MCFKNKDISYTLPFIFDCRAQKPLQGEELPSISRVLLSAALWRQGGQPPPSHNTQRGLRRTASAKSRMTTNILTTALCPLEFMRLKEEVRRQEWKILGNFTGKAVLTQSPGHPPNLIFPLLVKLAKYPEMRKVKALILRTYKKSNTKPRRPQFRGWLNSF